MSGYIQHILINCNSEKVTHLLISSVPVWKECINELLSLVSSSHSQHCTAHKQKGRIFALYGFIDFLLACLAIYISNILYIINVLYMHMYNRKDVRYTRKQTDWIIIVFHLLKAYTKHFSFNKKIHFMFIQPK